MRMLARSRTQGHDRHGSDAIARVDGDGGRGASFSAKFVCLDALRPFTIGDWFWMAGRR